MLYEASLPFFFVVIIIIIILEPAFRHYYYNIGAAACRRNKFDFAVCKLRPSRDNCVGFARRNKHSRKKEALRETRYLHIEEELTA